MGSGPEDGCTRMLVDRTRAQCNVISACQGYVLLLVAQIWKCHDHDKWLQGGWMHLH